MQSCFTMILMLAGAVFVLVTGIRWFEQVAEAVDNGWWNKTILLVLVPFAVWLYPSSVAIGRPTMPPRHTPVRGFGHVPLTDEPPPGAPKEFIGMPAMPAKRPAGAKPALDADKLAKLRAKMKEQGMLPDDPP